MADSEKMSALVELAGAVAHELNNIFTAVTGNLSLLDEEAGVGSETGARIDEVIRTAQRGIVLSSKLQAFAGRQPLRRKRTDLGRLTARVMHRMLADLPKSIHARIEPCREPLFSFVDEDKLGAAIEEIVRNAIAAMPDGGRLVVEWRRHEATATPQASQPSLRPGRYALIAIGDTGRGMAPEVAARAVDPLFTTKPAGINAGWGLSNCAGLARQSGGYMTLASRAGMGTRVEFYLPLQD